jgi:long-chain fatty acid transport protein
LKALLVTCSGLAALVVATADANAGGLAVREQSAWGQGASFAGVAAGGDSSAMFWNPATMTQIPGLQSSSVWSGILPYVANSPTAGSFPGLGGTGNSAQDALVPAAYYTWQIKPDLWIGMSVNSPFGLSLKEPGAWAGGGYGAYWTNLTTYNATPSIAYRINDWISIGAGVQLQYAQTTLGFAFNALGAGAQVGLNGGGWGYGFTGGVTLTPTPNLTVGVGYRSGINQKLNGSLMLPAAIVPISTPGSINTTVNLPDIVTASVRYRFAPQWTALGTVEWSNWSRIGTVSVLQPNGAPALVAGKAFGLPFQYQDGWFFSGGAEYQWNDRLALRSGVGYERSPVTDQVRIPLPPDNDRLWLSAGGTYQYSNKISLDLAYTHVFVKSTSINVSPTSGNPWYNGLSGTYIGDVSSHVDIISVQFHYRWDNPAPAPTSTLPHK